MDPEKFTAISNRFGLQIHSDALRISMSKLTLYDVIYTNLYTAAWRTPENLRVISMPDKQSWRLSHKVPTRPELVKIPERLPSSPRLYQLALYSISTPNGNRNDSRS